MTRISSARWSSSVDDALEVLAEQEDVGDGGDRGGIVRHRRALEQRRGGADRGRPRPARRRAGCRSGSARSRASRGWPGGQLGEGLEGDALDLVVVDGDGAGSAARSSARTCCQAAIIASRSPTASWIRPSRWSASAVSSGSLRAISIQRLAASGSSAARASSARSSASSRIVDHRGRQLGERLRAPSWARRRASSASVLHEHGLDQVGLLVDEVERGVDRLEGCVGIFEVAGARAARCRSAASGRRGGARRACGTGRAPPRYRRGRRRRRRRASPRRGACGRSVGNARGRRRASSIRPSSRAVKPRSRSAAMRSVRDMRASYRHLQWHARLAICPPVKLSRARVDAGLRGGRSGGLPAAYAQDARARRPDDRQRAGALPLRGCQGEVSA